MIDILSTQLGKALNDEEPIDERTDEEIAADEKRERIRFHREKVRNGPVKFSQPTSGQQRRAMVRATNSMQRKGYRRQVKAYFAAQRELMSLRPRLQAAGILPITVALPAARTYSAIVDLISSFAEPDENGQVEVTEVVVRDALRSALNRYQTLTGQELTALPEGYELPVAVAAR